MSDELFRVANLSDAAALAHLHDKVWQRAMEPFAPAEVRERLNEAHRLGQWTRELSNPAPGSLVLVSEREGQLVAMGAAGDARHPALGARGEIRWLYVDFSLQRQGMGRALIARLARHLLDQGHSGIALSVVAGNAPALAFYAALGGQEVGRYVDPGPIWKSGDVVIAWDGASAIQALAAMK